MAKLAGGMPTALSSAGDDNGLHADHMESGPGVTPMYNRKQRQ
jgi:hypothetical protein